MRNRDALDDEFRAWMDARGVTRDAGCAVRGDGARGRCVERAGAALAVGTTLATIPKSACLTTATSALGARSRARAEAGSSVCASRWRTSASLGAKSRFAAYLKTLPAREALPSTFAADDEARRALRGTTVEGMLGADERAIADDYRAFAREMKARFARRGVKMPTLEEVQGRGDARRESRVLRGRRARAGVGAFR